MRRRGLHAICLAAVTSPVLAAQCPLDEWIPSAAPHANARFGASVAQSGDRAVVGAVQAGGLLAVLVRIGPGWVLEQTLLPSGDETYGLGCCVALDGDTLVAGVPMGDGPFEDSGTAIVYRRNPSGTWEEEALLESPIPEMYEEFGNSVSIDGDTLVVGASAGASASGIGRAYVFARTGSDWRLEAVLDSLATMSCCDGFGTSVAIQGDEVLVGAPWLGAVAGSLYVFERAAGAWSLVQRLIPVDAPAVSSFGRSVALDGDVAVVGSDLDDMQRGAAYVFHRTPAGWVQAARLSPPEAMPVDGLGWAIDVSGERIVCGAIGVDEPGKASVGAAYLWVREGAGWERAARWAPPRTHALDRFGSGVSIAGDRVLVGASGYDSGLGGLFTYSAAGGWSFSHCTSTPNSTGLVATLALSGSHTLAGGDTVLHAASTPPSSFGLFVYGSASGAWPWGDGVLCIQPFSPGIQRLLPPLQASAAGGARRLLDFGALPPGGDITAGTSWYFQYWYRDTAAGGAGFNLSQGVRAAFCP